MDRLPGRDGYLKFINNMTNQAATVISSPVEYLFPVLKIAPRETTARYLDLYLRHHAILNILLEKKDAPKPNDPVFEDIARPEIRTLIAARFDKLFGAWSNIRARSAAIPRHDATDGEVYFSPVKGQVSTSYSDNALFGIANVSGNLAIAFNTTPDETLVVAPNSVNPSLATVTRLSSGAVVGAGSVFNNTKYTLAESVGLIGNWNSVGAEFLGFRFGSGH